MEKIRNVIDSIPPWLPTALTVALILWLTLAPDPLGDNQPMLFEGADKIVHAIMFGFLTAVILLDRQRSIRWKAVAARTGVAAALPSTLFGIGVEVAQLSMGLGRGFEVADMISDAAGAAAAAFIWLRAQHFWEIRT